MGQNGGQTVANPSEESRTGAGLDRDRPNDGLAAASLSRQLVADPQWHRKEELESSAEDVEQCEKTGSSHGDAELQQQSPVG
jgi:hypothetical protein